ncbi:flagellin [Devosia sp. J2-20]|uniref:flagellin N-terminal helical domain-containing protein n=1 Tax=Devosia sp. J2-20 TaxID=3026161 RepID=UPI00249BD974|nr:flagellin [Devosia sp. J2-20]WDQ99000.1 flagellin [Devosia sp. J2-20]
MSDISLSKAVRANLNSLSSTANMMAETQNRLSTGNKVNSALDNPSNWFTAKGLNNRAGDLNALLDGMANGIQTLKAADNGLSAMTKTLESMQSTLRQARQDKSFQTASYTLPTTGLDNTSVLSFDAGAIGDTAVEINLTSQTNTATPVATASTATGLTGATTLAAAGLGDGDTITVSDGTETHTYTVGTAATEDLDDLIAGINGETDLDVTASIDADTGAFTLTADNGDVGITVGGTGAIAGLATQAAPTAIYAAKTLDALVAEINGNTDLKGNVRASNDNGKLRIENQSTQVLNVDGVTSSGAIDGSTADSATIAGNTVRAGLADQFNELRDQLDKLADDASFNGINLLRGDNLAITFNETGTSSIDIQTKNGETVNSANLGVATTIEAADLDSDTNIDAELGKLKTALNDVRSQASTFGSNLSIVQGRQDFTKSMISTLQDGAGNLTLADMNSEAANLLALQTRQSLASNSLSLASQQDQSVLQLIR